MLNGVWTCNSRFVAREFKAMEFRDDLLVPGATHAYGRVIDHVALKEGLSTFTLDAEYAFFHADEHGSVYVPAPQEYLDKLAAKRLAAEEAVAWT